ncbi:hypothetical protein [Flavobacterium pectinovorum]|nr:hypothetical protein [Flavobacterium pectinovorum]
MKIAELLNNEFPEFKKVIEISNLSGIHFTVKPQGIYLNRSYSPKVFEEIRRNHNTSFHLNGILVFEKKSKKHIPLKLHYFHNSLTSINIDDPKNFHRNFDLNNIKIEEIEIGYLKIQNSDKEIVLKVLKNSNEEKLNLLDVENAFEIEIDEKLFYTILDMEDGNYIAVDKQGKVYRLNHDHKERVIKIAENPNDFFKIYNGQKSELENIMNE